jgi:NDP-sugar pyrophosphorylase family protein
MNLGAGLILAAGRGERLRAGVGGLPKPLVELDGITMLARQTLELSSAGAFPITAIINSETAGLISDRAINLPSELSLIVRDTTNSMETLLAGADHIGSVRFLAATVDAVLGSGELNSFASKSALALVADSASSFEGALGLVRWRGDRKPLFAQLDSEARITQLGSEPSNFVTAGVYYLPSRIFDFGDQARSAGVGALREFLALLLSEGFRFKGVFVDRVIDVDEPSDLATARNLIRSEGIRRNPYQ